MNRIGIFYEHIYDAAVERGETIEQSLANAAKMGYAGLECDLWRLSERAGTKALLDSAGMTVFSVYSTYDMGHESGRSCREKYLYHLETAAYFGADKVLCVPGFTGAGENKSELQKRASDRLNEMCEEARNYNITVTLEDYDDENSLCRDTESLEFFTGSVNGLRLAFDTGNFSFCLENAEDAYGRLKKHICHVHLKDRSWDTARADKNNSNGKADMSGRVMYPCQVCDGFIGIDAIVRQMLADGYAGDFSVEHFGAVNQHDYMKGSIENIKRIVENTL